METMYASAVSICCGLHQFQTEWSMKALHVRDGEGEYITGAPQVVQQFLPIIRRNEITVCLYDFI